MSTIIKTYDELSKLKTYQERFDYLKLDGLVGKDTFGCDRYLNQMFYKTTEWRRIRDQIIIRDNGCDLGVEGYDLYGRFFIHHINTITLEDIVERRDNLLNPNNLITVSFETHNAIHYGDEKLRPLEFVERTKNDTIPWK